MPDNAFHASYLLNGIKSIGVIIHRSLYKKQIDFAFGQHIIR